MGWTSSSRIVVGGALLTIVLLLLLNLSDRTMTGDEAYTIIQGKTVLEHGYPFPFYKNFEILPKATYYWGTIPLFNWTPWLESYIAALMLFFAGMSEFWLRLPFALFGIATIILLFAFTRKITKDKFVAIISTILLATSVTFLLHMREARWYSISAFFALAAWYAYWNWIKEDRSVIWLTVSAALLFHSQIFIFFAVMVSLSVYHILFARTRKSLKRCIGMLGGIAALTLPWFLLTGQLAGKADGLTLDPMKIGLGMALYGYYTAVLLLPVVVFLPMILAAIKKKRIESLDEGTKFIVTVLIASFAFLPLKGDLLPAVRYLVFLIPLFSIVTAQALVWFKTRSKLLLGIILVLIILTNYANILVFLPIKPVLAKMTIGRATEEVKEFIDDSLTPQTYFLSYIYEITHNVKSVDGEIIRIMAERGSPNDYFITSHFPHTLLIYTDMNVGIPDIRAESYYQRIGEQSPNITPNWIIPRGFDSEQEEILQFLEKADKEYKLAEYEPIVINMNDDERWASAPDPINHKFKTDRNGTLTIYYKP